MSHHCCLSGSTWAGSWSLEPELGFKTRYPDMGCWHLFISLCLFLSVRQSFETEAESAIASICGFTSLSQLAAKSKLDQSEARSQGLLLGLLHGCKGARTWDPPLLLSQAICRCQRQRPQLPHHNISPGCSHLNFQARHWLPQG